MFIAVEWWTHPYRVSIVYNKAPYNDGHVASYALMLWSSVTWHHIVWHTGANITEKSTALIFRTVNPLQWRWRKLLPPKLWNLSTTVHSDTSWTLKLLILRAARTTNLLFLIISMTHTFVHLILMLYWQRNCNVTCRTYVKRFNNCELGRLSTSKPAM